MDLFLSNGRTYTDADLRDSLSRLGLRDSTVLVYSRFLSFGRPLRPDAVQRVLQVLVDEVGPHGTLCVPSYTFSGYRGEPFDAQQSKSLVGVLGEVARTSAGFARTVHPVYSTSCYGPDAVRLVNQNPRTCFGPGSWFDLFTTSPNARILMLGTNLNAVTLAHHYDQRFSAPGRFLKRFRGRLKDGGDEIEIEFDSFVKDDAYYEGRVPCVGRLDAIAELFGVIERAECLGDWAHSIREEDFRDLYGAGIQVGPDYFLTTSLEEYEDYYEKNQFRRFFGALPEDYVEAMRRLFQRSGRLNTPSGQA